MFDDNEILAENYANQESPEPVTQLPDLEYLTPELQKTAIESEEADNPALIDQLAFDIVQMDYDKAKQALKDLYSSSTWTDPEIAAQKVAEISRLVDQRNNVRPEFQVPSDITELTYDVLHSDLDKAEKVKRIEDWREQQKVKLYNSKNPDDFINGLDKEQSIDQLATELRREVYGKDRSLFVDTVARGIETALSPLTGTAELLTGYEVQDTVKEYLSDYQNPQYDGSVADSVARGVGSVGGFAASAFNPVTAIGYLTSTLIDQGKQVYDTAYNETKSSAAARDALLKSAPGILLGTYAEKLTGGTVSALLKGKQGYLGTISGLIAGGGGAAAEVIGTGKALSSATLNPDYEPTLRQVIQETLVGAGIGGIAGGASDIKRSIDKEVSIRKLQEQLKTTVKENDTSQSGIKIKQTKDSVETRDNLFDDYVRPPRNESPVPETITETDAVTQEQEQRQTTAPFDFSGSLLDTDSEGVGGRVARTPRELTIIPAPEGFEPNPYMRTIVPVLGGELKLVRGIKDALGFYQTGRDAQGNVINKIVIDGRIFRDARQADATIAHEIMHLVDYAESRLDIDEGRPEAGTKEESEFLAQEPILHKLIRFNKELRNEFNKVEIDKEAKALSFEWRRGSDAALASEYRNNPKEIFADVGSAILNDPEYVAAKYPKIWETFQKGLLDNKTLNKFWTEYTELATNPAKLFKWQQEQREAGRIREAQIMQEAAEQRALDAQSRPSRTFKGAIADFKTRVVNRFNVAKDILASKIPDSEQRAEAEELYQWLQSGIRAHNSIQILMDAPINRVIEDYLKLDIPVEGKDKLAVWKDYEFHNRKLNETSENIETIKEDIGTYVEVAKRIRDAFDEILVDTKNPLELNPFYGKDLNNIGTQEFIDTLARLHNPKFSELSEKAYQKVIKARPDLDPYVNVIAANDTFRVRRYLADKVTDVRSSEAAMGLIKQQLGDKKFAALQEISKRFHDIIGNNLFNSLEKSEKISKKLLNRLKLNKNNYVTFNVLKYFEQDPVMDGQIKQQYGNFDDLGDELAATIAKSKAVLYSSEYQLAKNAAVGMAELGGYVVETVPQEFRFGKGKKRPVEVQESIYDQARKLQEQDPDNSYIITTKDGVPTLNKINSPEFAKMFSLDSFAKSPALSKALDLLETHHKLFLEREFKTLLSAPFVLSQPMYDRANEALQLRSLFPTFFGIVLDPKHRKLLSIAKTEAKKFVNGELTPLTKDLIKNGVLQFGYADSYGGYDDPNLKPENVVYEMSGVKIPGEEDATLVGKATRANRRINKALEKYVPGAKLAKRKAISDEARTKIMGYLIYKDKGYTDAEAYRKANEYFGTPDPLGGGTNATSINKLFLFGRAHINGMRSIVNQFKDAPLGFGAQYLARRGIPRMLLSGTIMAPLINAMFGEEEEAKVYKKFLDKIPTFDKLGRTIVPLGFENENGDFIGFNVFSNEIDPGAKAVYLRLPASRELVTVANLQEPIIKSIEDIIETGVINPSYSLASLMSGVGAAFGSQFSPSLQALAHITQLIGGENPWDYYRQKGILPRDVQEAGSMLDKFYEYLLWSTAATYPGIFNLGSSGKQSSAEPLTEWDAIASTPIVGPTIKRFLGTSNYGELEKSKLEEQRRKSFDAEIRLNLGEKSLEVYDQFRRAQATVSRLGKTWREDVSENAAGRITMLQNWNARSYRWAFNELRAAYERGDKEAIRELSENLEKSSQEFLAELNSAFP